MNAHHAIPESSTAMPGAAGGGVRARRNGARFHLRDVTRGEHDDTEAAFAPFDLSKPAGYRAFLQAHNGALAALEGPIEGRGWPEYASRRGLLEADLADLGDAERPSAMEPPALSGDAHVWGAQYVLEGSRLGGQILARQVAKGSPTRYLSGNDEAGTDDMRPWQEFCAALEDEARRHGPQWLADVEDGARATFRLFREAAKIFSGTTI
ncbi:biliverdin-producing heme oxygenase [Alteriqipengyuania flavescens]|uniref:biliverdin-producing heme oxygenase n=1 Tax=Alteriqipengyuania flavescens TaxID=3053610 RepID=UPI0025B49BF1|nr:biliverdin-producing heme oxygenase [Alteriqipengyuania flavescens]WJY19785.1 biliverdin-producing heme oxygenase [Alteriqipengyuania flavescens]WJY25727.1 biliverdin-producing heme oxygenase [Alteriqipengyuania flavescens]